MKLYAVLDSVKKCPSDKDEGKNSTIFGSKNNLIKLLIILLSRSRHDKCNRQSSRLGIEMFKNMTYHCITIHKYKSIDFY